MKKILLFIAASLLMCSCYSDKSTMRTSVYPDILITSSIEDETITYSYGDQLKMSATAIQSGVMASQLSYLWEIDMAADNTKGRAFLGDGHDISFKLVQPASDVPYILSLTVTNKESGYQKVKYWKVFITSSLGEGLLVGHTKDGGQTSMLDLISSPALTYGYVGSDFHITRDIMGIVSDTPLQGSIRSMEFSVLTDMGAAQVKSFNESIVHIATDKCFCAIDPTTYTVVRTDGDCFMGYSADKYDVTYVRNSGAVSCQVLCNGNMFTVSSLMDHQFAVVTNPMSKECGFKPSNFCSVTQDLGDIYAYDDVNHQFYTQRCWTVHQSSLTTMVGNVTPDEVFLADKTSVACGEFNGGCCIYILKGSDGSYNAVILNAGNNKVAEIHPLNLTDADKAVSYAFCDNANLFFYATEDKIYSSLLTSGNFTTKALSWKPDSAAEKITGIQQYLQGWYGNCKYDDKYKFILSTNRMQIIITTYNETTGEGKVYLRPFNVATGMFTYKDNGSFGGFGRITSVTETMR